MQICSEDWTTYQSVTPQTPCEKSIGDFGLFPLLFDRSFG